MAFLLGVILGLFTIMLISAESVCCEKTTGNLWCQNVDSSECDANYRSAPTSCDSTAYCQSGCCYDSTEGLCWENTPKQVCEDKGGSWEEDEDCNIPQCSLGCCILVDQGALVTLARCKSMSGFYGLNTDFRTDITDELTCIATAQAKDKGACVVEADYQTTCVFTTRENCDEGEVSVANATAITNASTEFYEGILCSAEELGTNCGKNTKTMLIDGKDEVYFVDTCGNPANIYDASKINDDEYWKDVVPKDESCGYGQSNAGSKSCGNCDYFRGSIGVLANASTGYPSYGDYICRDLDCVDEGRKHGESWCANDGNIGDGRDKVGSRYYKHICIYGEVVVESCADFRNEICIETETNGFSEAACRTNRWQDCSGQEEEADCENTDLRECKWVPNYCYDSSRGGIAPCVYTKEEIAANKTVTSISGEPLVATKGLCVPNYPPGYQFWGESSTTSTSGNGSSFSGLSSLFGTTGTGSYSTATSSYSAESQCAVADSDLIVVFKKEEKLYEKWDITEGAEWKCVGNNRTYKNHDYCVKHFEDGKLKSIPDDWIDEMGALCIAQGDCGGYMNYIGSSTDEGYAAYYQNLRIEGSGGGRYLEDEDEDTADTTGSVVSGFAIKDILRRMSES